MIHGNKIILWKNIINSSGSDTGNYLSKKGILKFSKDINISDLKKDIDAAGLMPQAILKTPGASVSPVIY